MEDKARIPVKIEELLGYKTRLRVVKLLMKHNELTKAQMIKKAKLNHSTVSAHLEYFKKIDLLQEKRVGSVSIYRYKIETDRAKKLKDFVEFLVLIGHMNYKSYNNGLFKIPLLSSLTLALNCTSPQIINSSQMECQ